MFDNYTGIFNFVLKGSGIIDKNINWLGDSRFALWCIILILFTTSVGQPIVLYVSALGNVDATLVEAAKVDGATDLQVFWKIKWPQMMPTTPLHSGHHHHQLLPVLRADPVADLRRLRHQYGDVLHFTTPLSN